MNKKCFSVLLFIGGMTLSGCSQIIDRFVPEEEKGTYELMLKQEIGEGELELLSSTITMDDDELLFTTKNIDETKLTFIYVANTKVFEDKITNDKTFSLKIKDIKEAHSTDYKPRVQLVQYKNDDEESDEILTFKQKRYKVTE